MIAQRSSFLWVVMLASPYYIGLGAGLAFYLPTSSAYAMLPSDPQSGIGSFVILMYSMFIAVFAGVSTLFGVLCFRRPFEAARMLFYLILSISLTALTAFLFLLRFKTV